MGSQYHDIKISKDWGQENCVVMRRQQRGHDDNNLTIESFYQQRTRIEIPQHSQKKKQSEL
jgi:hypothetical protein